MSRLRWLLAACVLAWAEASVASAHGRFPVATGVSFGADGDETLLVATSFGVLVRKADEQTFSWRCPDLLGVTPGVELSLWQTGGAWLVQQAGEAQASSDFFCTVEPAEAPDSGAPLPPSSLPEESFAALPLPAPARRPQLRFFNVRTPSGDRLYRSDDGGETYSEQLRFAGAILGFASDEEGSQLWLGGDRDGLWYSEDGGESFQQLSSERQVTCLAYRAPLLWLCEAAPTAPFQLGHSADGGQQFRPVLHFGDLTFRSGCGEPATSACEAQWRGDVEGDLSVFRATRAPGETADAGLPGVDANLPSDDAGLPEVDAAGAPPPMDAPARSAPGACSVQHARGDVGPWPFGALLLLLALSRARWLSCSRA